MATERLIDKLPGVAMPVEGVTAALAQMWDTEREGGVDYRASQMNVVLHFGLETAVAEGERIFAGLVEFAQSYPCRLVVLCPQRTEQASGRLLEGKLYSQCFIGKSLRDMCCCEALILGYPVGESAFLENQVSLWLESDLPIYHWFHRVPPERINSHYRNFMRRCRRVVYDSEIEGDAYCRVEWPEGARGSDLVVARTLPFRQHMGQFLSGYAPEQLVEGLRAVEVCYAGARKRMALELCRWTRVALEACGASGGVRFHVREADDGEIADGLRARWRYTAASGKGFDWQWHAQSRAGSVVLNGIQEGGPHRLQIEPLSCAKEIGEALFYG